MNTYKLNRIQVIFISNLMNFDVLKVKEENGEDNNDNIIVNNSNIEEEIDSDMLNIDELKGCKSENGEKSIKVLNKKDYNLDQCDEKIALNKSYYSCQNSISRNAYINEHIITFDNTENKNHNVLNFENFENFSFLDEKNDHICEKRETNSHFNHEEKKVISKEYDLSNDPTFNHNISNKYQNKKFHDIQYPIKNDDSPDIPQNLERGADENIDYGKTDHSHPSFSTKNNENFSKLDIFPKYIKLKDYYFLRKKSDLNIILVKVYGFLDDKRVVIRTEDKRYFDVCASELLLFNPSNKLFETLMNLPAYRNDAYIKRIFFKLHREKLENYMKKIIESKNTHDSSITEDEFYNTYGSYFFNEFKYEGKIEDHHDKKVLFLYNLVDKKLINEIKEIFVTGTADIGLYKLYTTVCKNGGMEQVTNDQKWKHLFYGSMSKTNVSYTMRTFYKKYLYEYEFLRRENVVKHQPDFNYIYKLKDRVFFTANGEKYYGTINLRRNRGINQYYFQFFGWSKEFNEWYSEDVLKPFHGIFSFVNMMKRKTRSSKANNLIDDPLTREKHSHLINSNSKDLINDNICNNFEKNDHFPEINKFAPILQMVKEQENRYSPMNRLALHYLGTSIQDNNEFNEVKPLSKNCETNEDSMKVELQSKDETNHSYKTDNNIEQLTNTFRMRSKKTKQFFNIKSKKRNLLCVNEEDTFFRNRKKFFKLLQEHIIYSEVNESNYMFKVFFNQK